MYRIIPYLLVALTAPLPAHAGFIAAGIGAIISTVGGWLAAGGVVGFLANSGLAFLASSVSAFIASKSAKQADVFRELQQADSLPVYRFAYGQGWVPGTPAPVRVKGRSLYACYILNSRPSQGPFTLYLDKRRVTPNGNDPYDFNGPGANGTNGWFGSGSSGPHLWYWISRGDQTGPPKYFLDNAPEYFNSTDGWRGLTVLWVRFRAGSDDDFADRWPSAPPEVIVSGRWSKIWDPRDPTQSQANPNTWKWSRNQALCALDALMNNPVRPYPLEHIWVDSFSWAADVADIPLPVKNGAPPPRFQVDGVLSWSEGAEIEDQVNPLLAAGASRWLRAYGQLGILPAVYSEPVDTITEVLQEQEMVFESWRPSEQLYTEAYANFTSSDRAYEAATTPTYSVAGAQAADSTGPRPMKVELGFVQDYRQAQYICKIEVMRTRMQKSMSFMAPPEHVDCLAGSNVTVQLAAPFSSRNGVYKVEEASPSEDPLGLSGGVAFRMPVTLRQESSSIYSWNPATEEKDMPIEDFDPDFDQLEPPSFVVASSGSEVALQSGNATLPRGLFVFPQVASARVTSYEWTLQRRREGLPVTWITEANGTIPADTSVTNLEGFTPALSNGPSYRVGVKSVASSRNVSSAGDNLASSVRSAFRFSNTFVGSIGDSLSPAPTPISATANSSGITVTYRSPNSNSFASMEIYASDTNDIETASYVFGPLSPGKNAVVSQTETGLTSGQTRYYWARSKDTQGRLSSFSSVMSATF